MTGEATDRAVLRVAGEAREDFLQGLVTNDLRKLPAGPVYAALLSPQGKYLADFLMVADGEAILLDADAAQAPALLQRLRLYRLRAKVTVEPTDLRVTRGLGPAPAGAFADPRHPALGWRRIGADPGGPPATDWDAIRVAHVIPEAGRELIPDETYILEAGFERLHGVDFRKGCYVGQEVTARMRHKTGLRKGLVAVEVEGPAEPGTEILCAGRAAGVLHTRAGDRAIAFLRFDRAGAPLTAGAAAVRLIGSAGSGGGAANA